jgi:hypothetical protein
MINNRRSTRSAESRSQNSARALGASHCFGVVHSSNETLVFCFRFKRFRFPMSRKPKFSELYASVRRIKGGKQNVNELFVPPPALQFSLLFRGKSAKFIRVPIIYAYPTPPAHPDFFPATDAAKRSPFVESNAGKLRNQRSRMAMIWISCPLLVRNSLLTRKLSVSERQPDGCLLSSELNPPFQDPWYQ